MKPNAHSSPARTARRGAGSRPAHVPAHVPARSLPSRSPALDRVAGTIAVPVAAPVARPLAGPVSTALLTTVTVSIAALVVAAIVVSCDADAVYWSYSFDSTTGHTNVHVVVTDNPADRIRDFHLTIDEVTLVRVDGHEETLYAGRGGYRRDILALRDAGAGAGRSFDIIAPEREIRSGTYDRLRLRVRDPEIGLSGGERFPPHSVEVVGDGTVDLVLEEPLHAAKGGSLYVVLDFDLERSFERRWWGPRPWLYRPLVLVESSPGPTAELLRREMAVEGRVVDVAADGRDVALELTGGRGVTRFRLAGDARPALGATGRFLGTLPE